MLKQSTVEAMVRTTEDHNCDCAHNVTIRDLARSHEDMRALLAKTERERDANRITAEQWELCSDSNREMADKYLNNLQQERAAHATAREALGKITDGLSIVLDMVENVRRNVAGLPCDVHHRGAVEMSVNCLGDAIRLLADPLTSQAVEQARKREEVIAAARRVDSEEFEHPKNGERCPHEQCAVCALHNALSALDGEKPEGNHEENSLR